MIRSGEVASWNTPWVLADVRRLEMPVRYRHKRGAVSWVNLDEDVSHAIARQVNDGPQSGELLSAVSASEPLAVLTGSKLVGEVQITQGNIDHDHIYCIRCAAHTLCALDQCAAGIRIAPPKERLARPAFGGFADILVVGVDVSTEKRAARDFFTTYAGFTLVYLIAANA
ncbi:hypothetical protein HGP14_33980 [Rhizobium sp. P32RR-XVIII]|uniref:hypothetical protein n=1 Tax=Rhizobium sp. P32RR-XVIII TaxID=2726738 RepID=UPI001456AF6D|nr:hypothetical protein [Rhizobium sp. P32RR-XVIII]NLS08203.1 hypothetical protein [Rhizobium sp. P32RR-XVIII]